MGKIQDLAEVIPTLVLAFDEKSNALAREEQKVVAMMLDLRECKRNVQALRRALVEQAKSRSFDYGLVVESLVDWINMKDEVQSWRPFLEALRVAPEGEREAASEHKAVREYKAERLGTVDGGRGPIQQCNFDTIHSQATRIRRKAW